MAQWGDSPSFLLVQLVSHVLRQLAELAFRLCVVGVDHEVLEVPQPPAQVLESLALFQEACDLGTNLGKIFTGLGGEKREGEKTRYLPCLCQRISIAEVTERHEGLVPLEEENVEVSMSSGCMRTERHGL